MAIAKIGPTGTVKVILLRGPRKSIIWHDPPKRAEIRARAQAQLHGVFPQKHNKDCWVIDASDWYTKR